MSELADMNHCKNDMCFEMPALVNQIVFLNFYEFQKKTYIFSPSNFKWYLKDVIRHWSFDEVPFILDH